MNNVLHLATNAFTFNTYYSIPLGGGPKLYSASAAALASMFRMSWNTRHIWQAWKAQLMQLPMSQCMNGRFSSEFWDQHLFGMRVCPNCPHCNHDERTDPCQDCFGSNAKSEGGVFGRIDAGYTSSEAQKSTGALHAHSQLCVQCLHQHEPFSSVLERLTEKPELVYSTSLRHGGKPI